MGSGDWFKTIISRKKLSKHLKIAASDRSNGLKRKNQSHKEPNKLYGISIGNTGNYGITVEDIAATRIQTAFRGFKARKRLRHLKGVRRLQVFTQRHTVTKQTSNALYYIHSWSKIQTQIRARRSSMVTEGQIRQKKQDNELKLEAKLHDLEVEWCGGSETLEEILARIQQREEAAVKRERTMAYAFSHQWRANSGLNHGQSYEFGKGTWGWSWMERWIAARPWESRISTLCATANKGKPKTAIKCAKDADPSAQKVSYLAKPVGADGASHANDKTTSTEPKSKPGAAALHPKTKNRNTKQETLHSK